MHCAEKECIMKEKIFTKNQIVFREGEEGNCFYQILDGTAGIYLHYGEAEEIKLAEMTAGQYIGEMAIIDTWPRSATVVAEDTLRVYEISEDGLNAYFEEQPDKILAIMKQLSARTRQLTKEYEDVKAFLKEKAEAGAEKKDGFFAKLKKYRDLNAMIKKNAPSLSAEDAVIQKSFINPDQSTLKVISCDAGKIIFREGDEGCFMYAVQSGSVGIYTHYGTPEETKLTTLYRESFFGEMSMIDLEKRSATAVAEEDGTCLEIIQAEDLQNLFKANPLEVDAILRHLSSRLRRLTKDYNKACEEAAI